MLKNFFFVLIIGASLACTKRATPSKSSTGILDNYSEDISYLLPDYKKLEEQPVKETTPTKEEKVEERIIESDQAKVDAVLNRIIENNKNFNNGNGYRIQVFSGNSRTDFENAKSYLLRAYPNIEIYESYSQPTYKIKFGDFLNYQDAEKINVTLKQRFGTTRIINDKINVKKALNNK